MYRSKGHHRYHLLDVWQCPSFESPNITNTVTHLFAVILQQKLCNTIQSDCTSTDIEHISLQGARRRPKASCVSVRTPSTCHWMYCLHASEILTFLTANAHGVFRKSSLGPGSQLNLATIPTVTVYLDKLALEFTTAMPERDIATECNTAEPPRDSSASQTTVKPASNGEGAGIHTNPSNNDREKMSAYVAFVGTQAEETLEQLRDAVDNESQKA
jgi:hypothetical protein